MEIKLEIFCREEGEREIDRQIECCILYLTVLGIFICNGWLENSIDSVLVYIIY